MSRMPKPDDKLVSRHPKVAMRVIQGALVAPQPPLPAIRWPKRTIEWWEMWGESPLTAEFTANDWSELLDTAFIHATMWSRKSSTNERMNAARELRQRAAKFGATPEDRVRLRIQFAYADVTEERADEARARKEARIKAGARERRGPHVA